MSASSEASGSRAASRDDQPSSSSGLPVPPALERGAHRDRAAWIESGSFTVDLLARTLGREDLAGITVLDVGCGTKITKTLLDRGTPVGRYVGVDVSAEVIDWLQNNVSDPRFEYHHLDALNEMYNPTGTPLGDFERLPVGDEPYALLCLFSVFTHLGPGDYVSMLHLLRKHVKPDGVLVFSLFLEDPDQWSTIEVALRKQLESNDPAEVEAATEAIAQATAREAAASTSGGTAGADEGFVDEVPEKPLLRARYSRDYALELLRGTGWEVVALYPPVHTPVTTLIQHHMVCRPI